MTQQRSPFLFFRADLGAGHPARGVVAALVIAGLALGAGCGGDKETAAPAKTDLAAAPAGGQAGDKVGDKAGDKAAEGAGEKTKVIAGADPAKERYALTIEPPAEAAVGVEGKVKLTIVPKDPWHMNLDYPTSLALRPPAGVTLAQDTLKRDDLLRLDEERCEVEVTFTPKAAGEQTITGEFKFAICQDDACAPVTEQVELRLAVK